MPATTPRKILNSLKNAAILSHKSPATRRAYGGHLRHRTRERYRGTLLSRYRGSSFLNMEPLYLLGDPSVRLQLELFWVVQDADHVIDLARQPLGLV